MSGEEMMHQNIAQNQPEQNEMNPLLTALAREGKIAKAELCRRFSLSDAALAQTVEALNAQGYIVEQCRKDGMDSAVELLCLTPAEGSLLPGDILCGLATKQMGRKVLYAREMGSTNTVLKQAAVEQVLPHGTLAICERQTQGKGRLSRTWETAEAGEGLATSLLLRPKLPPAQIPLLTLAAAVAAADAIEAMGIAPGIKWPNDVVIGKRKCVGILCEMVTDPQGSPCVVVGVGFNVNQMAFPAEIAHKATSLRMQSGKPVDRRKLLQAYLSAMEKAVQSLTEKGLSGIIEPYIARSVTLGSRVEVIGTRERFTGTAKAIDDTGALMVVDDDGQERRVLSGDVSVRGVMGYV